MEDISKFVKDLNAKTAKKYNNPVEEKPVQIRVEVPKSNKSKPAAPAESIISVERLQEAIIWSEILGKPVSKRRKRSM